MKPKSVLSAIVAAVCLTAANGYIPQNTHAIGDYVDVDGVILYVADDYCEFSRYEGDGEEINIPASYGGKPVYNVNTDIPLPIVTDKKPNVTSIVFPETFTKINYSYTGLTNLKNFTFLADNVDFSCYDRNFRYLPIEEFSIPTNRLLVSFKESQTLRSMSYTGSGDLEIAADTFTECRSLKKLYISDNYTSVTFRRGSCSIVGLEQLTVPCPAVIERFTFSDCFWLTSVSLNGGQTASGAFNGCTALKTAEFLSDIDLASGTFDGCPALENITCDPSVTLNGGAFNGCTALQNINGSPAFDPKTGEFAPSVDDFIRKNFKAADDVGFINDYVSAQVERIVTENTDENMTDIEKVKALHDWVCDNATYGTKAENSPEYHTDVSVLLSGETVCEGYARFCNLLYNAAGVESCFVTSSDHAWNIVKIGGHSFHADATWDDQNDDKHRYFLCSDSEFSGDHGTWTIRVPSSIHPQRTVLPACENPMGDTNADGELTVADLVKLSRIILGNDQISAENAVLCDLDFDGKASAFDIVKLRKKLLSK